MKKIQFNLGLSLQNGRIIIWKSAKTPVSPSSSGHNSEVPKISFNPKTLKKLYIYLLLYRVNHTLNILEKNYLHFF